MNGVVIDNGSIQLMPGWVLSTGEKYKLRVERCLQEMFCSLIIHNDVVSSKVIWVPEEIGVNQVLRNGGTDHAIA